MAQNLEGEQDEAGEQLKLLMEQFRDSSKDPGGPFVAGRGEFAPRWKALAGLVQLGDLAVEPLCQALQDKDGYTRRFAADALARIGDPRAVPPLVVALRESEVYAQRFIADALAVVGDARAVAPLCAALRNPDIANESLRALQAILTRAAGSVSGEDLRLVAGLADYDRYIVEVPDTDGGYLSWERVEYPLDCRQAKQLARDELARRG